MKRQPAASTLLVATLVAFTACDDLTAPDALDGPGDPSYIGLLIPAVQRIHNTGADLCCVSVTLNYERIEQYLWANGRATGSAHLKGTELGPAKMILYTFRSGALGCDAGSPTIHLKADARVVPASAGDISGDGIADIVIGAGPGTWRVMIDHGQGRLGRLEFEQDLNVTFFVDPCAP